MNQSRRGSKSASSQNDWRSLVFTFFLFSGKMGAASFPEKKHVAITLMTFSPIRDSVHNFEAKNA